MVVVIVMVVVIRKWVGGMCGGCGSGGRCSCSCDDVVCRGFRRGWVQVKWGCYAQAAGGV